MKKIIKTIYLFYFLVLALACKVLCTKGKYQTDLLIKTDRLGDAIIWQKIGFENYTTIMRSDSLASSYPVNIYKLYLNPIYTWRFFKQVYGDYKNIYILSSSKTSEMLALAYLCNAQLKTTIQDDNGNIMFASFFDRLICSITLPNMNNEYANMSAFIENNSYEINWSSLRNKTVLFMPFASNERKEISFDQYKKILKRIDNEEITAYVIGLVSEEKKNYYEKELEMYSTINSKINALKLDEYDSYKESVYVGMDTSIFHLLYNKKLCQKYYVIMGLGYNFRFIPLNDEKVHCIYEHCNYSYCHWDCKYSSTRCIKGIKFE